MRNFLALFVFISTMLCGISISGVFSSSDNAEKNYCVYDFNDTEKQIDNSFFTLPEANYLVGKKVISKNSAVGKNEFGRIVTFEMVATDKFLVEIYWGKGADDENSTVTFHDKNDFKEDFEISD